MRKTLFLGTAVLFFLIPIVNSAEIPFCPQIANYTMEVNLDTETDIIEGHEILSWKNNTETPTDELWFHLYWNAFQNNQSTFLMEASHRGYGLSDFDKDDWGYCRIKSMEIIKNENFTGEDLVSTLRYRQPDDRNEMDQTVFSVKLPYSIQPGETITLSLKFLSKVPRPISRTGRYKNYYFIAQWFPKIGVFQDGTWNCHQYHSSSEYFADYGTYDIKITLPSSFKVGATGEYKNKTDNEDGTSTHHFYQHSVHDFAWTASLDFLRFIENYEFTPGKSVKITLLLQPYHKHIKQRYMKAVKNAVKYASLWFGDYPYSAITCVDPAYNSRSGGMEYPTFFTGGTYFIVRKGIPRPEGVTIHEFGHNYFYGLIGTNEFENAWMDEGMNSFLDTIIYHQAYGEPYYSEDYFGIPFVFKKVTKPIESEGISSHRQTWNMDSMQRFSWRFMRGESYGANSYSKGQLMMLDLQRMMGEEVFSEMIKEYSIRHWWKHPKPEDFFSVVSEFAGEDMSWFFDQVVYGSDKLDYSIEYIQNQRIKPPLGFFENQYKTAQKSEKNSPLYRSEVLVRRLGGVKVPVDVLIEFRGGKKIIEKWDGQYRWKKFIYKTPVKINRAVVDPGFIHVLDTHRTNNSFLIKPNKSAPYKWVMNWMLWLQHAMELFTKLGS
ncbi:MAG: M1 family metallopeptidase [Candidatus Aminicenantes bacterium]